MAAGPGDNGKRKGEDKIQTLEFCCQRKQGIEEEVVREREREDEKDFKNNRAAPTCPYFDGNHVERGKLVMQERGIVTPMESLNCQVEKLTLAKSPLSSTPLGSEGRQEPRTAANTNRTPCTALSQTPDPPQPGAPPSA